MKRTLALLLCLALLCACAPTLAEARDRAYAAVDAIDWPGGFHRRDIGWRALPAIGSAR